MGEASCQAGQSRHDVGHPAVVKLEVCALHFPHIPIMLGGGHHAEHWLELGIGTLLVVQ